MGITIHYRGRIDDLTRIEELEDRVLDLAFALGGRATVWRSFSDEDPSRVVRGLMLEMAPGQETVSLLISPEGYLTPLFQIEDAEKGLLVEPPFCFIKTQFGSIQGHVAIVQLLDALRQQYCKGLEISDEGQYYETRDIGQLARKMQFLGTAIKSTAEGLRNHDLSDEAAEDPNIIALRVERIVKLVHEKMSGESSSLEHPETEPDDEAWSEQTLEEEVEWMDRHHPAVTLAQCFLMSVLDLRRQQPSESGFAMTLMRGAMEIVGGLVQATSDDLDDRMQRALAITQLKRALSGQAYARGAVVGLSSQQAITQDAATEFQERLATIRNAIHDLMSNAWDEK